ncbi:MAG: hypothetical protein LC624_01395 [Halobacteriales archaeon]|nr:hypothetical protein [Halobacteriales archaeon]
MKRFCGVATGPCQGKQCLLATQQLLRELGAASLDVAERFVLAAEQGLGLSFAMGQVCGAEAEADADPIRVMQPALESLVRLRRK